VARRNSGRADKGSRYYLQNLVNDSSETLNLAMLSRSPSLSAYHSDEPRWVSPLARQNYREFRDAGFLRSVGLSHLKYSLSRFWPRFGPSWDALATVAGEADRHGVILLEAKNHFKELGASPCGAKGHSLEKIGGSLSFVKNALGVGESANWLGKYYQYANRLAHLHWLCSEGIPAWLVFLYFIGDREQQGPDSEAGWRCDLDEVRIALRLPEYHALSDRIIDVFMPVDQQIERTA
jgi:hypothetical protein